MLFGRRNPPVDFIEWLKCTKATPQEFKASRGWGADNFSGISTFEKFRTYAKSNVDSNADEYLDLHRVPEREFGGDLDHVLDFANEDSDHQPSFGGVSVRSYGLETLKIAQCRIGLCEIRCRKNDKISIEDCWIGVLSLRLEATPNEGNGIVFEITNSWIGRIAFNDVKIKLWEMQRGGVLLFSSPPPDSDNPIVGSVNLKGVLFPGEDGCFTQQSVI